jgi:AraC-like DNA-binding protein/ligand-binding sensor protein
MDKPEPVDFVQQLGRSRIYEDYKRAFGKTTKLPLELSSIDKCREVHHVRSKYTNPFCAILSCTRKICGACLEVRPKPTGVDGSDTRTVRCFAGFTHSIVPVKWDQRVIGVLETGQVFLRTPTAARFKEIANQLIRWGIKLNLARLEDAYFRSRVVSPDQYRAIVRLLEIFAEHLALIANQIALQQRMGDPPMITGAKDYVASHQSDPIKLEEIARALNVSTFHFCRKFKHATGLTFVEYLSRVRIEKAKILLHNKSLRITEIAYEVGFQSLTHFNRIFRKLVGHSPTEYRSTVIETR